MRDHILVVSVKNASKIRAIEIDMRNKYMGKICICYNHLNKPI